jgi:hypothetical protein
LTGQRWRVPALTSMRRETLISTVGATIQRYLD